MKAHVNEDLCIGCGVCADNKCPMEAIQMIDDKPSTNLIRCIGCGLCVSGCPNEARALKKDMSMPEPPDTGQDQMVNILQETDRVGGFLSTLPPSQRILARASILLKKAKI